MRTFAALVASIALVAGCSNGDDQDQVVARVSGREVTKSAVERELEWLEGRAGRRYVAGARSARLAQAAIARKLVIREILELRASETGLQPTDDQIERKIESWKATPEFGFAADQRGAVEAEAREALLWEILIVHGTRGVPPAARARRNRELHDAVVREASSAWYAPGYRRGVEKPVSVVAG